MHTQCNYVSHLCHGAYTIKVVSAGLLFSINPSVEQFQ